MKSKRKNDITRSTEQKPFFKKEEPGNGFDPYQKDVEKTGPASIQRFGASEHKTLGDSTGVMIDIGEGVQLSFGDIVALAGDEFGSADDLISSTKTPAGRARIRAHLQRAGLSPDKAAMLPQPKDDAERQAQADAATSAYVALAFDNISHFSGGGGAFQAWFDQHSRAVTLAMQAGLYRNASLLNEANFREAFGGHFLTDAFSSGHVRAPRSDINDYYVNHFAPQVFDTLRRNLVSRMTKEIYDQIDEQTILNEAVYFFGIGAGLGAQAGLKKYISRYINSMIDEGLAEIGGRSEAIIKLGKAFGGMITLAIHNQENREGLWVYSLAHPEPWKAFGDSNLEKNPLHKALAIEAVNTSLRDLALAHDIGVDLSQESYNLLHENYLPATVYFAFNSADVTPTDRDTINALADYLNYHPTTSVVLMGHTDPLGTDAFNDDLGTKRAASVGSILVSKSVDPSRISIESYGEHSLVSKNPARYKLNRRVEIVYQSTMSTDQRSADEIAHDKAAALVKERVGPPYAAEKHFPREVHPPYAVTNLPVPDWKWGSLSDAFQTELNTALRGELGGFRDKLKGIQKLDDQDIKGFTIKPRPIVEKIFDEVLADPTKFLEKYLGKNAG